VTAPEETGYPHRMRLGRWVLPAAGAVLFGCAASGGGPGSGGAGAGGALPDGAAETGGGAGQAGSAGRDSGADHDAAIDGAAGSGGDASTSDADAGGGFTNSVVISNPANASFVPVVAARADGALIAWHEFNNSVPRIAYSVVKNGVPGPLTPLTVETLGPAERPSVTVTPSGYLLAYQVNDGTSDVARAVELDPDGNVTSGPDTISVSGAVADMVHAATNASGQEAFAWTDGNAHYYALRGPNEAVAATPVGTTLQSTGLLNFPRIALDASGNLFLSYRDGPASGSDFDVYLMSRPPNGSFGTPVNVSRSPGLLSDDISLAMESDGTLDLAWVEQNAQNVNAFEVVHTSRTPSGTFATPVRYGTQNVWTWAPSIVPGAISAWATGQTGFGPMYLGMPGVAPEPLLPSQIGEAPWLARDPNGALYLVFTDNGAPSQVHFAYDP
jgi:hypothetical protein